MTSLELGLIMMLLVLAAQGWLTVLMAEGFLLLGLGFHTLIFDLLYILYVIRIYT